MITIANHKDGCILPVRAQPGARKSRIIGQHAGALKVAVTAPPEAGRANKALIEVLSGALNIKRSQIELLSGETNRDKRFLIRGLGDEELKAALDSILNR